MKYKHKFKHKYPSIDPVNPYTATGFISYRVAIRGELYGEYREYTKKEAFMLPAMMRMLVLSKNEVCNHIMSMTDEAFNKHVREDSLRDYFNCED